LRRYRPVSTTPRIPVPIGLAIGSALAMLGLIVVLIGTGLVVDVARGFSDAFNDAMTRLTSQAPATPAPSGAVLDTPALDAPPSPGYTTQPSQVLQGTVPAATIGKTGYTVRIYQIVEGQDGTARTLVAEVPVGSTTRFATSPITLAEGTNTFAATLKGPNGEGNLSPTISYVLDTTPPSIKVLSPRQNAQVNGSTVNISGQTDPKASLIVRNRQVSGGGVTRTTAGDDGAWSASMPVVAGSNTIVISATDEAGNTASTTITIQRSYGDLAAHLQVTPSKFSATSKVTLKLVMHATSVNGGPLADAEVTFTVLIQGLAPIESPQLTTDATGTATWQIDISGATAGTGEASVMVTSPDGDTATATASITIT
jgi:predicted secreted protein